MANGATACICTCSNIEDEKKRKKEKRVGRVMTATTGCRSQCQCWMHIVDHTWARDAEV